MLEEKDTATFYSISNSSKGLTRNNTWKFFNKESCYLKFNKILPKIKATFIHYHPLPGFADWFLKQDNKKLDKILGKNSNKLNFLKDNSEIVNSSIF